MGELIAKLDVISWPGAIVASVLILAVAWVAVTFFRSI